MPPSCFWFFFFTIDISTSAISTVNLNRVNTNQTSNTTRNGMFKFESHFGVCAVLISKALKCGQMVVSFGRSQRQATDHLAEKEKNKTHFYS